MASCAGSESTCVLWKINAGGDAHIVPYVVTSKPFLLFDSEKTLQLHVYNSIRSQVQVSLSLLPDFNVSSTGVHIISCMNDESSVLYTCSKVKADQNSNIWSFSLPVNTFRHRCEILCFFRCEQPGTQNIPQNEILCLKSEQPSPLDPNLENLSHNFDQLLEDRSFSDVTLKCRDRVISAHRAVLAARSPVFAAMFRNKMAVSETSTFDISDVDPDVLESFLKYVYSGKITNLSDDNVPSLFSTGDKYEVRPLQQECSSWISKRLNPKNCIGFLQMADAHNYEGLKNRVVEFIIKENGVFKTEEWSQFKMTKPVLALSIYERYMNMKAII